MRTRGFTLVELVVAIVVAAIVVGFIASFIAAPVSAYSAQTRRGEMTDSAESAVRHLADDIASALPNSIRTTTIGSRRIIEMIPIDDSGLYRDVPFGADQDLNVNTNESQFDVLAPLAIGANSRIVIGNRTAPAAQTAYAGTIRVITPVGMASAAPGPRVVLAAPGFQFGNASPGRRVYVVSTATQYHCDLAAGMLIRYTNLPIANNIVVPAGAGTVLARDVTGCTFQFAAAPNPPAIPAHGGIATLEILISRVAGGNTERLRIAQQVRVRNPP